MQLDSCPLRAADITPDLQKKFAFLSGQIAMSFFCLPFCFVCLLHRIWVLCHFVCYFSMISTPLKFFIVQLNKTALICHSNFPSISFLFTVYHVTAHASLILLPGIFGLTASACSVFSPPKKCIFSIILKTFQATASPTVTKILSKRQPCGCGRIEKTFCRQRSKQTVKP